MRVTTLILEDNWEKVELLLAKGLIQSRDYYCSKHADDLIYILDGVESQRQYVLFVDGELPGSMDGEQFLNYAIVMHKEAIIKVVIISYNPRMVEEMSQLCNLHRIPYEVLRQ